MSTSSRIRWPCRFGGVLSSFLGLLIACEAAGGTTAWVGKSHIIEQHILEKPTLWGTPAAPGLKPYPRDSDPRSSPETNQAMRDNPEWWRGRIRNPAPLVPPPTGGKFL